MIHLNYVAGIRELKPDHSKCGETCGGDGASHHGELWRNFERIPAQDEFYVNGQRVSRDEWQALAAKLKERTQ